MEDSISRVECKTCQEKYDEINKSQNRRLDNLEADVKQVRVLAVSVEKMAVSLEMMAKELAKQGERLDAIEKKPADKWENAVWLVISALIAAAVGAAIRGMI